MKNNVSNQQLEICFNEPFPFRPTVKPARRCRASDWFQRMKKLVAVVVEWQPSEPPKVWQIDLPIDDRRL